MKCSVDDQDAAALSVLLHDIASAMNDIEKNREEEDGKSRMINNRSFKVIM